MWTFLRSGFSDKGGHGHTDANGGNPEGPLVLQVVPEVGGTPQAMRVQGTRFHFQAADWDS